MTHEELENKAYLSATGCYLTEKLSYGEFEKISNGELMSLAWEPFENWRGNDLKDAIALAAEDIINTFEEYL